MQTVGWEMESAIRVQIEYKAVCILLRSNGLEKKAWTHQFSSGYG